MGSNNLDEELEKRLRQVATIRKVIDGFSENHSRAVAEHARRSLLHDVERIEERLKNEMSGFGNAGYNLEYLKIIATRKGEEAFFTLEPNAGEQGYPQAQKSQFGLIIVQGSFFAEIEELKRSIQTGESVNFSKYASILIYERMERLSESSGNLPGGFY